MKPIETIFAGDINARVGYFSGDDVAGQFQENESNNFEERLIEPSEHF